MVQSSSWRGPLLMSWSNGLGNERLKTGCEVASLGERTMVELVDYKCANCGNLESFHRERNGISCKACGSRIFMKLRRHGTKRLSAE
ncbi:MAG: hypothetical protein CMB74_06435 [Euryarchaeota archaeon]|nr:hypothetical protein [Euryarchaeota archaeon]